MTTQTHQTTITLDDDVPVIRTTREFDAPPEKVFRAHTDPALFAQWVGPRGYDMRIDHYDARTGGSFRFVQSDADGEYAFRGCFHDVRPSEVIVQTFTYEDWPDNVSLERLTLEDLGDGRTRLVSTSLVGSFDDRDAWVASGMEDGVREGYERLDELLAR